MLRDAKADWDNFLFTEDNFQLLTGFLGVRRSVASGEFELEDYILRVSELRQKFPHPDLDPFFRIISNGAIVTKLRFHSVDAERIRFNAPFRVGVCTDLIWCLKRFVVSALAYAQILTPL